MRIVEAILRDQATALSVSSLVTDYYGTSDICLSLPTATIMGHAGSAEGGGLLIQPARFIDDWF